MDVKGLVALADITHGRMLRRTAFQDFVTYAALFISNKFDPVHLAQRTEAMKGLLRDYTSQEQAQFSAGLHEFVCQCQENVVHGRYKDLLGMAYFELGLGGRNGQDFSPPDIGEIVARLSIPASLGDSALPEQGFFTIMDPACGSGMLSLSAAEHMAFRGYNLCQHLVIQANDTALCCAHMSYVQLSCHGIPAVVIHGNTLTLEEHSRWYTPAYILGNWVWRCPLPFAPGRNLSDEWLKMAQDPMYMAIRRITWPELFPSVKKECETMEA
ncbi:hypothetical protein SDC9_83279 [bioreactor metagenome]|uniref:DNA methylase adenine-specific domain-containing protein n=1 Tax=bioreactor metagenome TaxID=1076179 RepID=A0A644Z7S8_9ZZZZ